MLNAAEQRYGVYIEVQETDGQVVVEDDPYVDPQDACSPKQHSSTVSVRFPVAILLMDTSLLNRAQTMQRKSMYEAEVSDDQYCYEAILEQARSLQRAEIKRYSQTRYVCR